LESSIDQSDEEYRWIVQYIDKDNNIKYECDIYGCPTCKSLVNARKFPLSVKPSKEAFNNPIYTFNKKIEIKLVKISYEIVNENILEDV